MEPALQAGRPHSGIDAQYTHTPFAIRGEQSSSSEASFSPNILEEAAIESLDRQQAEVKVNEWLNAPKGGVTRDKVREESQPLSAQLNWEIVLYALEKIQPKLNCLNENIRLLWIVYGNFESLSYNKAIINGKVQTKYESLGKDTSFNFQPPIQLCVHLYKLLQSLSNESNPSSNLKIMQQPDKIQALQSYLTYFTRFLKVVMTSEKSSSPPLRYFDIGTFIAELWKSKCLVSLETNGQMFVAWAHSPHEISVAPLNSPIEVVVVRMGLQVFGYSSEPLSFTDLSSKAQEEWKQASVGPVLERILEEEIAKLPPEIQAQVRSSRGKANPAHLEGVCKGIQKLMSLERDNPDSEHDIETLVATLFGEVPAEMRQQYEPQFRKALLENDEMGMMSVYMSMVQGTVGTDGGSAATPTSATTPPPAAATAAPATAITSGEKDILSQLFDVTKFSADQKEQLQKEIAEKLASLPAEVRAQYAHKIEAFFATGDMAALGIQDVDDARVRGMMKTLSLEQVVRMGQLTMKIPPNKLPEVSEKIRTSDLKNESEILTLLKEWYSEAEARELYQYIKLLNRDPATEAPIPAAATPAPAAVTPTPAAAKPKGGVPKMEDID